MGTDDMSLAQGSPGRSGVPGQERSPGNPGMEAGVWVGTEASIYILLLHDTSQQD